MTALRPCETCNRLVAAEETVTISAAEYRELLARPAPSKKPVGRRVGFVSFVIPSSAASSIKPPSAAKTRCSV